MTDQAQGDEAEQLRSAIAALEAQRSLLGDAVVDTAVAPLSEKLAALSATGRSRRRQVTVLFADITGYTTMSERLDPERIGSMLGRFWAGIDALISARRGVVYNHMGDGIMAVWGDTTSAEDDAEQAVRTGLAMLDLVRDEGLVVAGTRLDAQIRVGVNTGLVHLSDMDTRTAIGDTVNVAARLEGAARPGSMLISRATFGQVRGVFELSDAGDLALKGRAEPVKAYEVLRPLPRAFPVLRHAIEGIETEMAGRSAQFDRIVARHAHAVRHREFCVTTITGEPGIGKSRMLSECRDWLEAFGTPIRYFEGRCVPDSGLQPFALVRSILAHRFEISDDDDPEHAMNKLDVGLSGLLGDAAAELFASIGWLLGFEDNQSGTARADTTFRRNAAVADLLEVFRQLPSGELGVMLVMEDLQWADAASLDVFETLMADPPPGLVMLATARAEFSMSRPAWCVDEGLHAVHEAIALDGLDDEAAGRLLDSILRFADVVPSEFRQRVVSQASGNPFHLEELVKMFIDDGVIGTGDPWTIDLVQLDADKVPGTLTGVLQSRLDYVPPDDFQILQAASVLGRTFWDDAVGAIADRPPAAISAGLVRLFETELVQRSVVSGLAGSAEAAFRHDVTRAVTYDTIALDERPDLHRRAADWLERAAGERVGEQALTIARHLDEAEDPQRAASWYLRAAHQAVAQSSHREALQWYAAAAERCGDDVQRRDLQLEQVYAMITVGLHQEAKALVEPMIDDDAGATLSQRLLARGEYARILTLRDGDFVGAERVLRAGLDLQHLVPADDVSRHFLDHQLGILQIMTGRHQEAVETLGGVVDRTVSGDIDPLRRGWVMNALSHVHAHLGNADEAIALSIDTQSIAAEHGDPRLEMAAIAQRGLVALHSRQLDEALARFDEAQVLNRRNGDVEKLATVANYLGEAAAHTGDLVRSRHEFEVALETSRRAGVAVEEVRAVVGLVWLAAAMGHAGIATEAADVARRHPSCGGEASRLLDDVVERFGIAMTAVDGESTAATGGESTEPWPNDVVTRVRRAAADAAEPNRSLTGASPP
ncbi:MAG: adenylate/guanylate cyclase domain-containing protein [Ilumatobacter sp.]